MALAALMSRAGPAPAELLQRLLGALRDVEGNMDRGADMDGNSWEEERAHSSGSVEVWHARPSGSKAWRIKVSGACDDATPDAVYSQLCIMEHKMRWDHGSVNWFRRLRCFAGDRHARMQPRDRVDVEAFVSLPHLGGLAFVSLPHLGGLAFVSLPHLGGLVKPRCFLEARLTRWGGDGRIVSAVAHLSADDAARCGVGEFDQLARAARLPMGRNLPGSGMAFWPAGGGAGFALGGELRMVMHYTAPMMATSTSHTARPAAGPMRS
eukprot:gene53067-6676_t